MCMSQHDCLDTGAASGLDVRGNFRQSWRSRLKTCTVFLECMRTNCERAVHMQAVGEDDDDSDDEDMPPLESAK